VRVNHSPLYFVKVHETGEFPDLLEKELHGLDFLARQKIIRVPGVTGHLRTSSLQILILEWIEQVAPTQLFWEIFGERLAALHKTNDDMFGFYEDNYMGSLLQVNRFTESWIDFFIQQRLHPQMQLAFNRGLLSRQQLSLFESLYKKIGLVFNEEKPALLHGDLWSGNFISAADGQPVLIDPAVYSGHRSMDLGMTTLFGGFEKAFYESYHYHFPLPGNYREQWNLCNMYPLLIHLNLFGRSYLPGIEAVLKKFAN